MPANSAPTYIITGERAYFGILSVAATVSLTGVILAQLGEFTAVRLVASSVLVLILVGGVGTFVNRRRRTDSRPLTPVVGASPRKQCIALALLVAAAGSIGALPSEHLPLIGDSAIYPNTAALLARTGRLDYHFEPFDGLLPAQKELFFLPSDKQISGLQIEGYEGLLYGAYYVTDRDQNRVVASRPAGFVTWLALFQITLGTEGMFWATPLFGVLAVVGVYVVGARAFGWGTGYLAAWLMLISFPHIHFTRAPYAEAMAEALMWGGAYGMVSYLHTARARSLILSSACFGAAFLTRTDTLAVIVPALLVVIVLCARGDFPGASTFSVLMAGAVVVWGINSATINAPYVRSSWQLFTRSVYTLFSDGRGLPTLLLLLTVGGIALGFLVYRKGRSVLTFSKAFAALPTTRYTVSALLLGGAVYAYAFRPGPEFAAIALPYSHVLTGGAARYFTPFVYFLAFAGVIMLWYRGLSSAQGVLLVFVGVFCALFLGKYTTAAVYPVAIRRLLPEVLPGFFLLSSYAVVALPSFLPYRERLVAAARALLVLLIATAQIQISASYVLYREAEGTSQFVRDLAQRLPDGAPILFEPLGEKSQVGWFASPLWSVHNKHALLLQKGMSDSPDLPAAVGKWSREGKTVYFVSASDSPSLTGFRLEPAFGLQWDSSIVGQSTEYFPGYIWRFSMPLRVFHVMLIS